MRDTLSLKKSNCKNCYKCIRHCPVKSIMFSGNQAHIVNDECILCGQCVVVCPQNAKQIVSDLEKAKVLLQSGAQVVASIAPSFVANYSEVGIEAVQAALKKLGFAAAEETALGATIVKQQYEAMLQDKNCNILISSCCHSVNLLIQKHFPGCLKYLAGVMSPMLAHCADIKKRYPGAKTVFIGPCVSKKDEAQRSAGLVDCALTFEELDAWLKNENIEFEHKKVKKDATRARLFPTTGGILKTMDRAQKHCAYVAVDGVQNCIDVLKDIEQGNISRCFIEMSACEGSCIGGPVMQRQNRSKVRDLLRVAAYAGKKDFPVPPAAQSDVAKTYSPLPLSSVQPSPKDIEEILKQMGKLKPEDELNCGSCGYNTCRDKAAAVYRGKANLSMCLPFLKEKAENFSDIIINNTPNAIIVLNKSLEVQQINQAACTIMNIKRPSDVLGEEVVRILDPKAFKEVLATGRAARKRKIYLADYNKYVEKSILFDKTYNILICIMRDVTEEETLARQKDELRRQTIQTADDVIKKQMRIVQDIASLLGETTAETKIALSKLKDSTSNE